MRVFMFMLVGLLMVLGGPAHADAYRLKPGDVLDVSVWQDAKLNRQIVVAPDGFVAVPLAGRFKAGGLTVEAVEASLRSRLQKKFTSDLDVTVSFVQAARKEPKEPKEVVKDAEWTVYVTGEVNKPGVYVVPKRAPTVLQAIALSGGLGPFAAERRIQIHRKRGDGDTIFDFDYDYYTRGEGMEGNITLRTGDVVVVPERGLFE